MPMKEVAYSRGVFIQVRVGLVRILYRGAFKCRRRGSVRQSSVQVRLDKAT